MKLLSVNVAQPREATSGGRSYRTGIYKRHVMGRVWLGQLGLEGDGQADRKAHGGPNRAVYCYSHENYDYWAAELERDDWHYGAFGENLTLLGLGEDTVCVGDSFRIGGAVIQASQPRVPCYKLAGALGIPGFEKTFLQANRIGFYARVLEEGYVEAGDPIQPLDKDAIGMTVAEVNAALLLDRKPESTRRALRLEALSPGWRRSFKKLIDTEQ